MVLEKRRDGLDLEKKKLHGDKRGARTDTIPRLSFGEVLIARVGY
jgi:hypothetical protein